MGSLVGAPYDTGQALFPSGVCSLRQREVHAANMSGAALGFVNPLTRVWAREELATRGHYRLLKP